MIHIIAVALLAGILFKFFGSLGLIIYVFGILAGLGFREE